jgi:hypothetical protein
MSRCSLRYLFTFVMYLGIAVFLIPYISGKTSSGTIFLIVGMGIAIASGLLRCFFMEADTTEQHLPDKPCP